MITKSTKVDENILGYIPTEHLYKILQYQGNEEAGDEQEFMAKYDEWNLDLMDKRWEEPVSIRNAVKYFYKYTRQRIKRENVERRRLARLEKQGRAVVRAEAYSERIEVVDILVQEKLREIENEKMKERGE